MSTPIAMKFEESLLKEMEADMRREHYDSRAEYLRSKVQENIKEKYLQQARAGLDDIIRWGRENNIKKPPLEEFERVEEEIARKMIVDRADQDN